MHGSLAHTTGNVTTSMPHARKNASTPIDMPISTTATKQPLGQAKTHMFVPSDPLGFPDRTVMMMYTGSARMLGATIAAAMVGAGFKPAQTYEMHDTHLDPREQPQAESRALVDLNETTPGTAKNKPQRISSPRSGASVESRGCRTGSRCQEQSDISVDSE